MRRYSVGDVHNGKPSHMFVDYISRQLRRTDDSISAPSDRLVPSPLAEIGFSAAALLENWLAHCSHNNISAITTPYTYLHSLQSTQWRRAVQAELSAAP